ncbi:MAG: hypothetical protein HOP97_03975 [Terrabacter sp.]|nr:hypothetical protein [Dermatophilaceae bacterium]NUS40768.1 hypothetical protein [Terrabacter sp.]
MSEARANLWNIAAFATWSDSKRARIGSAWSVGGGSRVAETPVPFDPRVSRVLVPIHNDLTGWARIVWDDAPNYSEPAAVDTASVARWLVDYAAWFAGRQDGPDAFAAWERARLSLERLFDRPPDRVYLGRCGADTDYGPCSESLYLEVGNQQPTVDCPRCTHGVVVADRRDQLAAGVENYLGTARELSRLLSLVLGEDANPRMLWAYAKHGLIQSHGVRVEFDTLGRRREVDTYRIGEVREAARMLAADEAQRKSVRRIMRGSVAL